MSGLRIDLDWIARATGGRLISGAGDLEVGAIVTDSRAAQAGDLFIALRGPRFDGHDFVADVLARGVAGVVIEAGATVSSDAGGVIVTEDTLRALQDIGGAIRREAGTTVVAITGSAGKTTTKEAIAECLAARFRVVKNKGNLNNHIGLPLSLTALRSKPDVAVMELGMNHAGEISTLVAIARPNVRVWTNVGDAHIGFFESADAIAEAKAEILEDAGPDTVLVCNADDRRVMARVGRFNGRLVTFGTTGGASVEARDIEDSGLSGMRARVATPAGERVVTTPLLGRGNLSNALAAIAVSLELGVPLDDVVARLAALVPASRRGAVRALRNGVRLVDDSYNSSPAALRRALDVIEHEAGSRRVAVLGEMLELGEHSTALHQACGRAVVQAGVARLFVVGGAPARALGDAAVAAGLDRAAVSWFETSDAAATAAVSSIAPGDVVLVKGSRGIRTDIVADRIVAELT